ncbi:B-cell lymphoma/leukemia 10 [Pseudophryne corroboree]|uniref:B-cell lymphoma/leukemia 10 n=1 Tax=Pseudophryne corroboree TaxID=495146 RepID=UPI003081EAFE
MTPLKLNEEEMADVKRDTIECLRPYLCEKLMAERHFDYLRCKTILNKDDTEEILSQTTSRKRAGELLDRLSKNPKGLDALIESIRLQKTQDFLIEKITDEVLRVKNEKLEFSKGDYLHPSPTAPNGLTTDLYKQCSDNRLPTPESTVLYHPEGESSLPLYFNRSLTIANPSMADNRTRSSRQSTPYSTRLPKPGEIGAPPLPVILPQAPEESRASSPIDNQFLPLRSSSPSNPSPLYRAAF